MGVDDDSFAAPECIAKHDVSGLAADSGKLDQRFHSVGDRSLVPLDQCLAQPDQALRLVPEKAGAADHILELFCLRLTQCRRGGKSSEHAGGYHVDTLVGALRTENGSHQ
jgi:hypothetical protein